MQESSESGVNKPESQTSPSLLLPGNLPADCDVTGVESEGSSLSTPSGCTNIISHDSEVWRRSRGSSFSLPSAESILSIFRTPSRKTRGSPSSLEISLPSSVCTPKSPQSCCTSSSSGSSGKRECELCAICLSPVTSRAKERPVTRTSCQVRPDDAVRVPHTEVRDLDVCAALVPYHVPAGRQAKLSQRMPAVSIRSLPGGLSAVRQKRQQRRRQCAKCADSPQYARGCCRSRCSRPRSCEVRPTRVLFQLWRYTAWRLSAGERCCGERWTTPPKTGQRTISLQWAHKRQPSDVNNTRNPRHDSSPASLRREVNQ